MPELTRREFLGLMAGSMAATLLHVSHVRGAPGAPTRRQPFGVPVFMYHTTHWNNLTTEQFREQMDILHELGFRTITFRALHGYLQNGTVPRGRVVLTFDDVANWSGGGASDYMQGPYGDFWSNAFPALTRYGFTAVLGVVTGGMPKDGAGWTWKKLRFLQQLDWEIASHSVTHTYQMIGQGGTLTKEQVLHEFSQSRAAIARECGIEPITYIWPFGAANYKDEALQQYSVLVREVEAGPVWNIQQLQAVPRYHPDLHTGEGFRQLMSAYAEEQPSLLVRKELYKWRLAAHRE